MLAVRFTLKYYWLIAAAMFFIFGQQNSFAANGCIDYYRKIDPIVMSYAYPNREKPNAEGLFGSNKAAGRWLDVALQRGANTAILMSAVQGNGKEIQAQWPAIDAAFSHQYPDGDFMIASNVGGQHLSPVSVPTQDAFFIGTLSSALLVLRQSDVATQFEENIKTITPKVALALAFLMEPKNINNMLISDTKASNRLIGDASTFISAGKLTGNQTAVKIGEELLARALAKQTSDGVLPENGGSDVSYQAVSMLGLFQILIVLNDEQAKQAMSRALVWELHRISPEGELDTSQNTRTGKGQERYFGRPKEVNYRELVRALAQSGVMLDNQRAEMCAELILKHKIAGSYKP